jgi:hypothetical protein
MSESQGNCGDCTAAGGCIGSPIFANITNQLSSGTLTNARAELTIFQHIPNTTYPPKFKSAADYLRYKKGQLMTSPKYGVYKNVRSLPTSLIVPRTCVSLPT